MGKAVHKQPDGLLAVWDTMIDDFVMVNTTPEEFRSWWVGEAVREANRVVDEMLARTDEHGSSTWSEETFASRLSYRNARHGTALFSGVAPADDPEWAVTFTEWLTRQAQTETAVFTLS